MRGILKLSRSSPSAAAAAGGGALAHIKYGGCTVRGISGILLPAHRAILLTSRRKIKTVQKSAFKQIERNERGEFITSDGQLNKLPSARARASDLSFVSHL